MSSLGVVFTVCAQALAPDEREVVYAAAAPGYINDLVDAQDGPMDLQYVNDPYQNLERRLDEYMNEVVGGGAANRTTVQGEINPAAVELDIAAAAQNAGLGQMPSQQFQRMREGMSAEQRAVFAEVQHFVRSSHDSSMGELPPMRLFITGGAGWVYQAVVKPA
jgi:hypothetical protein